MDKTFEVLCFCMLNVELNEIQTKYAYSVFLRQKANEKNFVEKSLNHY